MTYLILQPAAAGELPAPTQEQMQAFYEERKASFRTPEYRALNVLSIDPAAVAKPGSVPDADARRRYEQNKASFGTPEPAVEYMRGHPERPDPSTCTGRVALTRKPVHIPDVDDDRFQSEVVSKTDERHAHLARAENDQRW